MKPRPITADDEYSYPLHMAGTASPTQPEPHDDLIDRLHAVVEEVTGRKVEKPEKPRMGFLP